ncbi:hypothetical protein J3458_008683 [Metarhizium acridum]|uniref:uncharacterized protein n=1 Tax=Metarhizium acridum TaxID=92637 RepID=UPI001C6C5B9F|nr:hypothetical protein J3458_008683 [Metarhizium acridum]
MAISIFFKANKPKDSPFTKHSYSDPAAALDGVVRNIGLPITSMDVKVEAREGKEPSSLLAPPTL